VYIILEILQYVNNIIWGFPMLMLIIGTGVFLTIRLRFLQLRKLLYAHRLIFAKDNSRDSSRDSSKRNSVKGDISQFQALTTALAATLGTGNIAGVATAIYFGGAGALFWMWISGFIGMATKYSEAILAVKFRVIDERGNISGGPMYYIEKGLGIKWLGILFCVFGSLAAFGIGNMVQSNSVAAVINSTYNISPWITGVILMLITSIVILGGIQGIGKVTAILVPIMALSYTIGGVIVIAVNYMLVPVAFQAIIDGAFSGMAITGGTLGSAIRFGVARGVFSNEAGIGSSAIAAAAARTDYPAKQALVSMTQTFIDTIIICTITGFAILTSGALGNGLTGAALTTSAFQMALPGFGAHIVSIGLVLFAYSTILGWCYYGEKCIEYLMGRTIIPLYRALFLLAVFYGAILRLDLVWAFADIMNGLMAIPNLIALIFLSNVVISETNRFFFKNDILKK
jgi:AGCS family alanine or glycine:cation symporter